MKYVRLKSGATLGMLHLRGRQGTGVLWRDNQSWIGVIWIDVPFDPDKMELVDTDVTPPAGVVSIEITDPNLAIEIKDCDHAWGGYQRDAQNVTLIWRMKLSGHQYRLI